MFVRTLWRALLREKRTATGVYVSRRATRPYRTRRSERDRIDLRDPHRAAGSVRIERKIKTKLLRSEVSNEIPQPKPTPPRSFARRHKSRGVTGSESHSSPKRSIFKARRLPSRVRPLRIPGRLSFSSRSNTLFRACEPNSASQPALPIRSGTIRRIQLVP